MKRRSAFGMKGEIVMAFKFEKDKFYMQPVFFGPTTTMQSMEGKRMLHQPSNVECLGVSFETNQEQVDALLPECFTSNAPVISVQACEFNDIGWLAGHSYTLINISTPVHFKGERDDLDGDLVLVMFENHADPIVAGRDGIGYSKIYADMPKFGHYEGKCTARAYSWDFKFMDLQLDLNGEAEDPKRMMDLAAQSQGKMNYRYIPSVDDITVPDAEYPVFNPKTWEKPADYKWEVKPPQAQFCKGTVKFYEPQWEDMPTYYRVGKGLADLEIKKYLGGQHIFYTEPCDYMHSFRLR